jgi:DNA repair protein RadA/Sms
LYVTGEESAGQVRLRAERIGALEDRLLVAAETDLGTILAHVEATRPDLLLIDSIQAIASAEVEGTPGGVSQVREVASALVQAAKRGAIPIILVGHVTKDGAIAGPRLIPDPSGLFLSHGGPRVAGTCTTVSIVGKRPLPAEIQALVAPSALANPRRATSGIDSSRVAMVLAVLHRRAGLTVASDDVYVSTIGGARAVEPAADLALALALASAVRDRPVRTGYVAIGEVALSGAIRPVVGLAQRVAEAARLGFTDAIVPEGTRVELSTIRCHETATLTEAISRALPAN